MKKEIIVHHMLVLPGQKRNMVLSFLSIFLTNYPNKLIEYKSILKVNSYRN
jgi:hypothetical protein